MSLFRRTKSEPEATDVAVKPGGKGRPTPTRKEAEAAAKARARAPRNSKEMAARAKQVKTEDSRKIREGMKAGDERYLLPRDKGPVRHFVRDFVDARFTILELLIPLLIIAMVLGYSGSQVMASAGFIMTLVSFAFILVDVLVLRFRLRKELARRFPDDSAKGTTWYAVSRSMQMKFMRMPKPQVKIGQQLPETYR